VVVVLLVPIVEQVLLEALALAVEAVVAVVVTPLLVQILQQEL
jgi:hypothetical protein